MLSRLGFLKSRPLLPGKTKDVVKRIKKKNNNLGQIYSFRSYSRTREKVLRSFWVLIKRIPPDCHAGCLSNRGLGKIARTKKIHGLPEPKQKNQSLKAEKLILTTWLFRKKINDLVSREFSNHLPRGCQLTLNAIIPGRTTPWVLFGWLPSSKFLKKNLNTGVSGVVSRPLLVSGGIVLC